MNRTTPSKAESNLERFHRKQDQREAFIAAVLVLLVTILAVAVAVYINGWPFLLK